MKKIIQSKKIIRRMVTSLLSVLGIGTLTACYGVYPGYFYYYGRVTSGVDADGDGEKDGIKGIKVELSQNGHLIESTETDEDGTFYISYDEDEINLDEKCTIILTDVDGEENGKWKTLSAERYLKVYTDDEENSNVFTLESDE